MRKKSWRWWSSNGECVCCAVLCCAVLRRGRWVAWRANAVLRCGIMLAQPAEHVSEHAMLAVLCCAVHAAFC